MFIAILRYYYRNSEPGFPPGFFGEGPKSIVMQISVVMLIFLALSNQTLGGRAKVSERAPPAPPPPQKESQEVF